MFTTITLALAITIIMCVVYLIIDYIKLYLPHIYEVENGKYIIRRLRGFKYEYLNILDIYNGGSKKRLISWDQTSYRTYTLKQAQFYLPLT